MPHRDGDSVARQHALAAGFLNFVWLSADGQRNSHYGEQKAEQHNPNEDQREIFGFKHKTDPSSRAQTPKIAAGDTGTIYFPASPAILQNYSTKKKETQSEPLVLMEKLC